MKFSLYILPRDARSCGDRREAGAEGEADGLLKVQDNRDLCVFLKKEGLLWMIVGGKEDT